MVDPSCFFNQQVSDSLQHVAVFFEIIAVALLIRDYQIYRGDIARHQRGAVAGTALPKKTRSIEFWIAVVIGVLAILMEIYQLLSQPKYLGC